MWWFEAPSSAELVVRIGVVSEQEWKGRFAVCLSKGVDGWSRSRTGKEAAE
jgi:hypothetical protein